MYLAIVRFPLTVVSWIVVRAAKAPTTTRAIILVRDMAWRLSPPRPPLHVCGSSVRQQRPRSRPARVHHILLEESVTEWHNSFQLEIACNRHTSAAAAAYLVVFIYIRVASVQRHLLLSYPYHINTPMTTCSCCQSASQSANQPISQSDQPISSQSAANQPISQSDQPISSQSAVVHRRVQFVCVLECTNWRCPKTD